MSKLRVWWIPQIGMKNTFYVEIESITEGDKLIDTLAKYDLFQYKNKVKTDYANTGGIQYYEDESNEWCDYDREFFDEDDLEELGIKL